MNLQLADRKAIISGANRGIRRSIALAYAAEGIHLALLGRNSGRSSAVPSFRVLSIVMACHVSWTNSLTGQIYCMKSLNSAGCRGVIRLITATLGRPVRGSPR
jgi:NAD(P)-dependent dehydrogenase (short-subunit alcohol dehydrogenase family)